MLTRGGVSHQYGPAGHCATHPAVLPPTLPPGGGLQGGAVILNSSGWVGISRGGSGYGYLGLDPSDPSTWVTRRFAPAPGMIAYLNGAAWYG